MNPLTPRGIGRLAPGTLGGRSRIASPVIREPLRIRRTETAAVEAAFLTAGIVPTSVGQGRYLRTGLDASCPLEVLDFSQAIEDAFPDAFTGISSVGVGLVGGSPRIFGYGLFSELPDGDAAVYYLEYPSLAVLGRSIVPRSDFSDNVSFYGPPVFDNVGDLWAIWFNPSDNHVWLTHSANRGPGVDYGTTPDDLLEDFGESGVDAPSFAVLGWNPYDNALYYRLLFNSEGSETPGTEIHRYTIGDGDSIFCDPNYARSGMLTWTPDGALWSHKREFSGFNREMILYRIEPDGTITTTADIETPNINNTFTGSAWPLTDNSVLIRGRSPSFTTWQVQSDLSFATSACSLTHGLSTPGSAVIATGPIS